MFKKKKLLAMFASVGFMFFANAAEKIEDLSGICYFVGGNGEAALRAVQKESNIVYVALKEKDVDKIKNSAGEKLLNQRLYIGEYSEKTIPFADHYLDAIIIANSAEINQKEIERTLCPGAKAYKLSDDKLTVLFAKPAKLKGAEDWTHFYHGSDNNPVSGDSHLKWPFSIRWQDRPYRGAQPTVSLTSNGRVFVATGEAYATYHSSSKYTKGNGHKLTCRNIYNGQILWQKNLDKHDQIGRQAFIAAPETFTYLNGYNISILDAATGKEIKSYKQKKYPKYIAKDTNAPFVLLLGNDEKYEKKWRESSKYPVANMEYKKPLSKDGTMKHIWGFGDEIIAVSPESGKELWSYKIEANLIDSRVIGIKNGKVFAYAHDTGVFCIDLKTGKEIWNNKSEELVEALKPNMRGNFRSLYAPRPSLLVTDNSIFVRYHGAKNSVALSIEDGKILWKVKATGHAFFEDGKIYSSTKGGGTGFFDPITGSKSEFVKCQLAGCGPPTVSENGYYSRHSIAYDKITKTDITNNTFRGGCWQDCLPGSGYLVTAPYVCGCNYSLRGWNIMGPLEDVSKNMSQPIVNKVSDKVTETKATENDWVTYSQNNNRSSNSKVAISAESLKWTAKISENVRVTPPISVGDKIYVGSDTGEVTAINISDGKKIWSYWCGGTVYAPPTYWNGRLFVGSADGKMVCLNAETGKLLYSLSVAQNLRNIYFYGRLVSTWSIHSGILINKGIGYLAAGITNFDTTVVMAFDAKTGATKWLNNSSGIIDKQNRVGVMAHGSLTIAKGKLWLAGGNGIYPASYDLETGKHKVDKDAKANAGNRGWKIANFKDKYILQGGKMLYIEQNDGAPPTSKASDNWWIKLDDQGNTTRPPMRLTNEVLSFPAWNNEILVCGTPVKKGTIIMGWEITKTLPWLEETYKIAYEKDQKRESYNSNKFSLLPKRSKKLYDYPMSKWSSKPIKDVIDIAIGNNSVAIITWESPKRKKSKTETIKRTGKLIILNIEDGSVMKEHKLTEEPTMGSICIANDGSVIVSTVYGSVYCFK